MSGSFKRKVQRCLYDEINITRPTVRDTRLTLCHKANEQHTKKAWSISKIRKCYWQEWRQYDCSDRRRGVVARMLCVLADWSWSGLTRANRLGKYGPKWRVWEKLLWVHNSQGGVTCISSAIRIPNFSDTCRRSHQTISPNKEDQLLLFVLIPFETYPTWVSVLSIAV